MDYLRELEARSVDTFPTGNSQEVMINCPFHDDENPSCEVNTDTGLFYCFGCGTGGTFLKIMAELDGMSIQEAARRMRDGQRMDEVVVSIFNRLESLDDEKQIPFKFLSKESFHRVFCPVRDVGVGRFYLENRGITVKTMKQFDLRWAVEGIMRDRVIVPVYTDMGKLLTYAGRTVYDDVQPKTRKVRSSGSALFGLFEIAQRRDGRTKLPCLIVTEGEFDAMYLQQKGLKAVSTMGTAKITEDQLALLRRYTKEVWFSYDGDAAGQKAQHRAMQQTRRVVPTYGVSLPEGKDPNELSDDEINEIYGRVKVAKR